MLVGISQAGFYTGKINVQFTAQRKHSCHCATKTGTGIAFLVAIPGNGGTTGVSVETLPCKRKKKELRVNGWAFT